MTMMSRAALCLGFDGSGSVVLRRRRFQLFLKLVDQVLHANSRCRILDVGGEPAYWNAMADLIGDRKVDLTLVNLVPFASSGPGMESIEGDARNLGTLEDMSFDLVHSNSVIEHVGTWADMSSTAREVRRLAPGYYVQTPYFWFPVEPHCTTAFFHWLPYTVRASMLMRKPRGPWGIAPDIDTAMRQIQSNTLLDRRMMAALFPDATLESERFAGLVKSLIAIREPGTAPGSLCRANRARSQELTV